MKKLATIAILGSCATGAFAQTTLITGFEPSAYNAANPTTTLTANSWSGNLSATSGYSCVLASAGAAIDTQSVLMTTNANTSTNYRLDRPGSEFGATNKYLSASVKLFIASTGANTSTANVRQFGLLMNGFNNALMLDQTGKIWVQNSGFSTTNVGTLTSSAFDRWIDLNITTDITGGISTGTIDGQAFTINSGIAGSNNVTGFSLFSRSNGSSGVAGSNLGRAFFDSVNVTNVVVPEPASMAVIAVGAFGLLVRRKRSKK